ncbi:ion transporter [Deinococcus irradiatisoli]|uniref:Ion transporter n=1 Tax=Deinococcus irradiatisoli TaxID=2202254 RepID=A0A2Z3JLY3_9DEIO|nr:ion transporter [Deinococcus irradiatisoli]AWN22728.1 ion transporter [Deinococcus irradiatisoli]
MPDRRRAWRRHLGDVIFGLESWLARAYDVALMVIIGLSVLSVMLESVPSLPGNTRTVLRFMEWVFTGLFTLDYLGRLLGARRPWHYARSFYGVVDLLSILPSYLALFFIGTQYLLVIRVLRILRLFRVFKLTRYLSEASLLGEALRASRAKITVFMVTVLSLVLVFGTLMYLIEGPQHGFTSIPTSVYWAVVTISTVGYGDISPQTPLGKLVASVAMLFGYGIIAVPTGIVTAGLVRAQERRQVVCPHCGLAGHEADARFCKRCGQALNPEPAESRELKKPPTARVEDLHSR